MTDEIKKRVADVQKNTAINQDRLREEFDVAKQQGRVFTYAPTPAAISTGPLEDIHGAISEEPTPAPQEGAPETICGYGATFRHDLDKWVIHSMPDAMPIGVDVKSREACDRVLSALRTEATSDARIAALESVCEALEQDKAFAFDPTQNFIHSDDGGAPEHAHFYVPRDEHDARISELDAKCASLIGHQAGLLLEELEKVRNEALKEAAHRGYVTCAQTRHVSLGDIVAADIRALKTEQGEG